MNREKAKKIVGTAADVAAGTVGGVLRLALRIIMIVLLVLITTALLFACIFAYYVKTELDSDLKVTLEEFKVNLSSSILFTDSDGETKELCSLASTEGNRVWVDYENIPEYMEKALVAIEDKRFYEHKGVDWYRTAGAFVNMFLSMKNDFGGSTITQQLIKNVTTNNDDTVKRKLLEIFQALELEKTYTKEEIIEWYLNYVYFGQGCNGIYTAAQTYFGKDVWDLSLAECASIVGITNNPSKYDPFIANTIYDKDLDLTLTCREWNKYRQEVILGRMYEDGYITYDEYQEAVAEELQFVRAENATGETRVYSWFEEVVIDDVITDLAAEKGIDRNAASRLLYTGGYQIYSTLDMGIQDIVDSLYEDLSALPQPIPSYYASNQQLQSAIVIMDPYTGCIVALSGGVGEKTRNFDFNRATQATRPAGSSTKPLSIYGPALEYGLITQNTLVNDAANIKLEGTSWYPTNSPPRNEGIITIRYALQLSKNTVAAQILDKLTPAASYDYMVNKLGFTTLVEADCDYAPLAMGQYTYGVNVREMAQAYCSFVNNGILTKARTYTKVLDSEGNVVLDNQPKTSVVWSPNTAANICNMLENAVDAGTGREADFYGMSVAGKTGTTSDSKDRYFCGFTPYYVAAVWTGYDIPEYMNFSGNPAAQIFRTVMSQIHAGLEDKAFPAPVIGKPTNIFGDLTEAKEEQDNPKPTPTPTPSPEPTPTPEPPEESQEPVTTEPPSGETTAPEPPDNAGDTEGEE